MYRGVEQNLILAKLQINDHALVQRKFYLIWPNLGLLWKLDPLAYFFSFKNCTKQIKHLW